jgi:hypothetical protein
MKSTRWFSQNHFFSHLRFASAVTLISAAAAMAFVSTAPSSSPVAGKSTVDENTFGKFNKFRMDRDELFNNKRAMPGPERDRGPLSAAEEQYDIRAYPAKEIPLQLTLNAQTAFKTIQARSNPKSNIGIWNLIGPSTANQPDILSFSGAATVTSGRITALAIAPNCSASNCRVWAAAAGGGIWRTDNALSSSPSWTFVSGSFATNAIGALTYDAAHNTLYAGTGEPNASVDSEAGMGLYKSTDGGDFWTLLPALTTTTISGTWTNKNAFLDRAINSVVVDPANANILYVGSASGVRGVASVSGAAVNPPTPLPARGVYKSTDGGQTFMLLNSSTSGLPFVLRGVTDVQLDPTNHNIIYAGQFGQGVFRSTDAGVSWTRIFAPVNGANPSVIERDSIAVTALSNGHTRMYLGAGDNGTFTARFYRSDQVETGTPTFTNMTTTQNAGYCRTQCWYDNVVYSPAGQPDKIFLGGAFDYSNYSRTNNGRAFIYSTNGGTSFTDMTWDATTNPTPAGSCCQPNAVAPNGMHPDSHAIVQIPGTDGYIFGSDGGLVRSSGAYANISSQCSSRGLSSANLALCQQLLSSVPTQLYSLNTGLSTLQFQSVSYNPLDPLHNLLGGTQDNGTWSYTGSTTWNQAIYGDGGQSGFNAANPALQFNTFTGQANDANFQNGDPSKWVIISAPIISSPEGAYFYPPIISDLNPINAGSIYQGSFSVWRTQDWGGNQALLEANCPEFTTPADKPGCGDFVPIGPAGATDLCDYNAPVYGADRRGGAVAAITRAKGDTGTLWVATGTGRVFISKNANAAASSVTFTRLDNLPSATADPSRFPSSIYIDPANSNHAWISYSGYNANTPSQPGHVFSVTYDPTANAGAGDATWTNLDGGTGPMGDLPVTGLVRSTRGDLFAGTDFGVLRLESGSSNWTVAGTSLPAVEVAGLTLVNGSQVLYAATHGRSVWSLKIP